MPRASTATLLALLLMAVGGATGISRAPSQTEAAPVQKKANDPGTQATDGSSAMTERTTVATIGESIVFKGELSGDEDLVIDGQVEGKIDLNQNALTVGEQREGQGNGCREDGSRGRQRAGATSWLPRKSASETRVRWKATFVRRGW